MLTDADAIDHKYFIFAGKFRRYHGERWWRRLLDVRTNWLNLRDFFLMLIGIYQTRRIVRKQKPKVVFVKGGFVAVPVGLAAARYNVPLVTHDSDITPGLANRLVGRWAVFHATGMPSELYQYPVKKTEFVGIPLSSDYQRVTKTRLAQYRRDINLPLDATVLFVTGGSQGAQGINSIMVAVVPQLLKENDRLHILHQVGRANKDVYGSYSHPRLRVFHFLDDMYKFSGAADLIICRGSATTIAELAVQEKACLVIPGEFLAGGHQTKNAQFLAEQHAAIVVEEKEATAHPTVFAKTVQDALQNDRQRRMLQQNIGTLARQNAAGRIADILLKVAYDKE